jgi:hypothetical protein
MARHYWLGLVAAALLAGCQGRIGEGPGGTTSQAICVDGDVAIGKSPMRRLNRTEYLNTVRDLFAPIELPELAVTVDKEVSGFDNNVETQTVFPVLVEAYYNAAGDIAEAAVQNLSALVPCPTATPEEQAACGKQFAASFAERAYRRPLSAAEIATFEAFLEVESAKHGFPTAVGMLIEGVLLSPHFLYRPEFGLPDPSKEAAAPLTGHELASRLSYFLWQTMPDDALFAAAAAGSLETKEGLESEARRMIDDPRARAAVADFHRQWLELDRITNMSRDAALFPAFNSEVPGHLHEATARYLDHLFWESDGTLNELLLAPKAYVNDALAPLYGVPPTGSQELVLIDLNSTQRAGVLTQAGPMAGMAHEKFDAPILRGVFVLERLLCSPPPPPPPNVADIPPPDMGEGPMTTRQRIEKTHVAAACVTCHESIDNLGFAFNNYDAVGQFRTQENGLPVDSTGKHPELGAYNGAIELSQRLAESESVKACAVTHWFRFGMGRSEAADDACELDRLKASFNASGGSFRDLVVDIVRSDSFRYRIPVGGQK